MTPQTASIVEFPERKAVTDESVTMQDRARALRVTDGPSYARAAEFLKGVKSLRLKVSQVFDSHIKRAFDAHRALTAEKKTADDPLQQAETIVKGAMGSFDAEQVRLRQEAQRKANEEARRLDEAERLDRAAALEREATATGDTALQAEAEAIISEPVHVVAPTVADTTPKIGGITRRETWNFRIADASKLPREYTVPNETAIRGVVRSLKGATQIPGVEVFPEYTVAASAR